MREVAPKAIGARARDLSSVGVDDERPQNDESACHTHTCPHHRHHCHQSQEYAPPVYQLQQMRPYGQTGNAHQSRDRRVLILRNSIVWCQLQSVVWVQQPIRFVAAPAVQACAIKIVSLLESTRSSVKPNLIKIELNLIFFSILFFDFR